MPAAASDGGSPWRAIARFRADPRRAIFIQGVIGQSTIDQLTPEIVRLQAASREPITVYIDSPGGSVYHAEALLTLLRASNQDCDVPCPLITVVTKLAASAAADLLAAGDYALAYPRSTILFHGVRRQEPEALTMEQASELAESLKVSNHRYARELSERSEMRFMLRYLVFLWPKFARYRSELGLADVSDIDCFIALMEDKLSEGARELIRSARAKCLRYEKLLARVVKKLDNPGGKLKPVEVEARVLKAVIDFEVGAAGSQQGWTFEYDGLAQLREDFSLLLNYLSIPQSEGFKRLCRRWSDFILTEPERASLREVREKDRPDRFLMLVGDRLHAPWALFVAICDALQEGENLLNATDAFWLGLVDEVVGDPDLPCLRVMLEYQPPPE